MPPLPGQHHIGDPLNPSFYFIVTDAVLLRQAPKNRQFPFLADYFPGMDNGVFGVM